MSESGYRTNTGHADAGQAHTTCPDCAPSPIDNPARRNATGGRHLLDRILNTAHLEQVVPRLQPDLLHRVIQSCGLEDCCELVALATSEQLARIFDLDLWRAGRPGTDEQFDPDRFGLWIEVLVESGAELAAQKIAGMDVDLVVAGLAQHMLVYDRAAVTPYETLDGELIEVSRADNDGLSFDMGGYLVVTRPTGRADSWDSIIKVLLALGEGHCDYFRQVMDGCRELSNSGRELDGLDELLAEGDQAMLDVAVGREGRREKQGYVTPAQARAFLQMARELRPDSEAMPSGAPPPGPPESTLARAYFQALNERIDESTEEKLEERLEESPGANAHSESGPLALGSEAAPAAEDIAESVAAVFEVLHEAGILEQAPRALLGAPEGQAARLGLIQSYMQIAAEHDQAAYSSRNEELAYLANTLIAGCSIQARPFTAREASDAAVAVCNLGLENWGLEYWGLENRGQENRGLENGPRQGHPANAMSLPGSFLIDHDLVSVFQVGWAVLHNRVGMYAAEQLIAVLARMQCEDPEIQAWLDRLRLRMTKHWRAGTPWRARDELEVIAVLDTQAWAVLLGLIDECPVLHPFADVSQDRRMLSVTASDFEFISENSQIGSIHEFMQSLPERLRG